MPPGHLSIVTSFQRLRGAGAKRPPLFMDKPFTFKIGEAAFLFLPSDEGGKAIRADRLSSIVPNYNSGGAMIFILDTNKAISVDQSAEEIVEAMQ